MDCEASLFFVKEVSTLLITTWSESVNDLGKRIRCMSEYLAGVAFLKNGSRQAVCSKTDTRRENETHHLTSRGIQPPYGRGKRAGCPRAADRQGPYSALPQ